MTSINNKRSRNWCFTINNYNNEDIEKCKSLKYKYIILGHEVGNLKGTPHIQGYVNMSTSVNFQSIKKCLGDKAHIEMCKGNQIQNINYCSKEGNLIFEDGNKPAQGKRNDIKEYCDKIMAGLIKSDDICIDNPNMHHKYGRTFDRVESIRLNKNYRNFKTECEWIYGETGSGKSEYAFKDFDPENYYVVNCKDKGWWDGYRQQEYVIIDDFRGDIDYDSMLRMLDDKPNFSVSRRNMIPVNFTSKKVFITSSLRPEDVYHNRNDRDKIAQLLRRIKIVHMVREIAPKVECIASEMTMISAKDEKDKMLFKAVIPPQEYDKGNTNLYRNPSSGLFKRAFKLMNKNKEISKSNVNNNNNNINDNKELKIFDFNNFMNNLIDDNK